MICRGGCLGGGSDPSRIRDLYSKNFKNSRSLAGNFIWEDKIIYLVGQFDFLNRWKPSANSYSQFPKNVRLSIKTILPLALNWFIKAFPNFSWSFSRALLGSAWLSLVLVISLSQCTGACWEIALEPFELPFILSGVCCPSEANYCSNPFEVFLCIYCYVMLFIWLIKLEK